VLNTTLAEDFPNERNKNEGIQKEFLDVIHDSTLKRLPLKMKAWKNSGA